jgi:hypothetical protein
MTGGTGLQPHGIAPQEATLALIDAPRELPEWPRRIRAARRGLGKATPLAALQSVAGTANAIGRHLPGRSGGGTA